MIYTSTRDNSIEISGSRAVIAGISEDGGLFVPKEFPQINIEDIRDLEYKSLALHIIGKYFTDIDEPSLKKAIDLAYDEKFNSEKIVPIRKIGDSFFMELYHGPTLAFKDMALSLLPYLLKESLLINNVEEDIIILTATSGDTGKAALEAFAGVDGIKIVVFYPEDGVSKIQKLQMNTQKEENTFVVGIRGNFDDAQNGVKRIFEDRDFNKYLSSNNYKLSSANSINIGRLIPQIVYYFYSYIYLLNKEEIRSGEKVNIVVPTGNFGNILAAFYAKNMGLPVNKFICASNENKVLTDFLNEGVYDRRRDLILTSSPSMDILISSNLERFLFHLGYRDGEIKLFMKDLVSKGVYSIDKKDLSEFYGNYSTGEEVEVRIRETFDKYNYLIDTHTAVALDVLEKYEEETGDTRKVIIASTASPFKFPLAVGGALGLNIENKDDFKIIENLSEETNVEIPSPILNLKSMKIVHNNICEREDMQQILKRFLEIGDEDV